MRALKMRHAGAGHQKLTTTSWEDHRSWSFYKYMRNCWRTQHQPFSGHSAFEANWKGESWISECLMSWPQIKKLVILKCHLLLLYPTTVNHFLIRLWRTTKNGFYMTTSGDQLSGWTEKKLQSTSQSQLCTKKGHGQCVVVCAHLIHYSFLNLGETITSEKYAQQIDEMHWNLQCLQLALFNSKVPILLHNNTQLPVTKPTLQKLNELGYRVLPHPPYSLDLSPTNYHFFKGLDNFFCRENTFTTNRRQKMLCKS